MLLKNPRTPKTKCSSVIGRRLCAIHSTQKTPNNLIALWRHITSSSSPLQDRSGKFSITEQDLSPSNMTKFERLDSTGSGSSLNGEDITKPFLIGVAGGTASGKVRYYMSYTKNMKLEQNYTRVLISESFKNSSNRFLILDQCM